MWAPLLCNSVECHRSAQNWCECNLTAGNLKSFNLANPISFKRSDHVYSERLTAKVLYLSLEVISQRSCWHTKRHKASQDQYLIIGLQHTAFLINFNFHVKGRINVFQRVHFFFLWLQQSDWLSSIGSQRWISSDHQGLCLVLSSQRTPSAHQVNRQLTGRWLLYRVLLTVHGFIDLAFCCSCSPLNVISPIFLSVCLIFLLSWVMRCETRAEDEYMSDWTALFL